MKNTLFVILFAVLQISAFSQKYVERADAAFNASEYYNAIALYKNAYNKITDNPEKKAEIAYRAGYCYRRISKSDHAELWFAKAIELLYAEPVVYLHYADALRMNEKYDDAIEQYEKYLKFDKDSYLAERGIQSCRLAQKWTNNSTPYKVVNVAWINSEYSDFSPTWGNTDQSIMYFTSSREGTMGDDIHGGSGQNFSDIFSVSKDSKGSWSTPYLLEEPLNTYDEEGTPCLNSDYSAMLFTRCEYSDKKESTCKLYLSVALGDVWNKPELFKVGTEKKDSSLYAHPSLAIDGLKLYFTSDRAGGEGGYDIWFIERATREDAWGEPQNAGNVVNSEGDEMYPYIRDDGTLYFSSNGHHGMGGFDLFRVNLDAKGKEQIVNLMYPLNSPADDFGILFENNAERGFFSSNRKGSVGYDDIWSFSLPPLEFSVTGKVVNEVTRKPLANTKVKLIGNNGVSLEAKTDAKGNYSFDLLPSANYIIMATSKGFLNGKQKITTEGLEESKDFEADIEMTAIDIPVEIPNIMYDFGKWTLRPESIVSLEKLIEILEDNPNIIIELGSHSDYRGSESINREISQKRAQAVVDFLILKGVDSRRLVPKGYGSDVPKKADRKVTYQYDFIREGTVLNRQYIESLPANKQEIAHQLNRRTEFKVLSTNYRE